jgi:hypothetical protein
MYKPLVGFVVQPIRGVHSPKGSIAGQSIYNPVKIAYSDFMGAADDRWVSAAFKAHQRH